MRNRAGNFFRANEHRLLGISMAFLICYANSARADSYAYMLTGPDLHHENFGVVNLTSGVYTSCGSPGVALNGLAVGPDRELYSNELETTALYKVNRTNGSVALVGHSGSPWVAIGSATENSRGPGLYGVDDTSHLFSIDYQSGAATQIGSKEILVADGDYWGLSTGSKYLFLEDQHTLFSLKLLTGAQKLKGMGSAGKFSSLAMVHHVLYAGSAEPAAIYSVDPSDGSTTLVSAVTGFGASIPLGLAPIKQRNIDSEKMCEAHEIP